MFNHERIIVVCTVFAIVEYFHEKRFVSYNMYYNCTFEVEVMQIITIHYYSHISVILHSFIQLSHINDVSNYNVFIILGVGILLYTILVL